MSVLFKALEKAERGRVDAGRTAAAAPASPPGVHIARAKRPGRGGGLWRAIGVVAMACLGATITAMFLYADDIEGMLADVVAPSPPPAVVAAPASEPPAATPPLERAIPVPVEQAGLEAAPEDPAGATAPDDDFVAGIIKTLSPPLPPQPQSQSQTLTPGTTNLAELMAAARAIQSGAVQGGPVQSGATEGGGAAQGEATQESAAFPSGSAPLAPSEPAVPPEDVARTPPPRATVEDTLEQRARASEALALRPPVTVERRAAQIAGAPDAVQVTVPTVQTRDTITSSYRALLRGEYHAALAGYEEVLADDPRSLQALLGRGAALHKLRRLDEAREAYERVLGLSGDNREALTNLLSIVGAAAPQEALERLLNLQQRAPDFGPVAAQVGIAYAALDRTAEAIAHLERAVALEPSNLLYRYNLAVIQDQAGLRQGAAVNYRFVLDGLRQGNATAGSLDAQQVEARLDYLSAVR